MTPEKRATFDERRSGTRLIIGRTSAKFSDPEEDSQGLMDPACDGTFFFMEANPLQKDFQ